MRGAEQEAWAKGAWLLRAGLCGKQCGGVDRRALLWKRNPRTRWAGPGKRTPGRDPRSHTGCVTCQPQRLRVQGAPPHTQDKAVAMEFLLPNHRMGPGWGAEGASLFTT